MTMVDVGILAIFALLLCHTAAWEHPFRFASKVYSTTIFVIEGKLNVHLFASHFFFPPFQILHFVSI